MGTLAPGTILELPLFPLNTVLFPGMGLPLHIFEERYKQMVAYCLEQRSPFGVVLIEEGQEVGGPAVSFDVGTIARITSVQHIEEGRLNLLAQGERRFRIVRVLRQAPYMVALVTAVASEEADSPEAGARAQEVEALFASYYSSYLALSHQWARSVRLPSEPDALADFVAGRLLVDRPTKQGLLETLAVPRRLAQETAILEELVETLAQRLRIFHNQRWNTPVALS